MLCHVMAFLGNIWPLKKKEGFTLLRIFVTIKEVWPLMKKLCILAQNVAKNSTTVESDLKKKAFFWFFGLRASCSKLENS